MKVRIQQLIDLKFTLGIQQIYSLYYVALTEIKYQERISKA